MAGLQEESSAGAGNLGVQNIRSDYFVSPLGPEPVQLPRAFLVFGQKFAADSWALSQTVFDSIRWVENGETNKVDRRVPSGLDVAFAVLQNAQVVPELVARLSDASATSSLVHAVKWRDGRLYQHNLAAVRKVIDSQKSSAWESSMYMSWLSALRELSAPTTDEIFPETMRTKAWAMKTLNTQLASWTQLRHDTVLYVKQSYTSTFACSYPAGYVEPRTAFWQGLAWTAERAASLIEGLSYSGSYTQAVSDTKVVGTNLMTHVETNVFSFATLRSNQVTHLHNFAATVARLADLWDKELKQECFNSEDERFIRNLIENSGTLPFGCAGIPKFDGWYPRLFYHGIQFNLPGVNLSPETNFQETYGAGAADRLVVDVHTDAFAPGDPGGVLHEAIGKLNLLIIAVESGPDRMIFAGPVLSHYEFEIVGDPVRLTDSSWDASFKGMPLVQDPSRVQGLNPPSWTTSYLIPAK